jgi:arylsulfatase A-like enzyme
MGWPMVRRGRYKLIACLFKGTALFDLEADPGETKDIAEDHPALTQELTETIREHHGRPRLDLWGDPAARDEQFLAGAPLPKPRAKAPGWS